MNNVHPDHEINPILLDTSKYQLGRYGNRRLQYLKEQHPDVYTTMIFKGTLGAHLEEVNQTCNEQIMALTEQLAQCAGVTEQLKASNPFAWMQQMNCLRSQAEEIILQEMVYSL